MAETIISPGVFTEERDLSFLPQGIGEIGAAIIGPTIKGPAFVPTTVTSFSEFENTFGGYNTQYYVPYTVREYLSNGAPSVTIVRVLGIGGYQTDSIYLRISSSAEVAPGTTGDTRTAAVLKPSRNNPTFGASGPGSASVNANINDWGTFGIDIGGSGYTASFDTGSSNYITKVFSTDPMTTATDVYVYKNFEEWQVGHGHTSANTVISAASGSGEDFTTDYSYAYTPMIHSQPVAGTAKNLFRVRTRSHGNNVTKKYKVAIADLNESERRLVNDLLNRTLGKNPK